jgi:hypothetical protein
MVGPVRRGEQKSLEKRLFSVGQILIFKWNFYMSIEPWEEINRCFSNHICEHLLTHGVEICWF